MSDFEEVDVVDAEDRVVGRALRSEVRRGRLRHRAVYVLVFNARGQLFVHRRSSSKDIYPSCFDVAVGGVVTAGESYDDAGRRELGEEIGVDTASLRRITTFQYEDEKNAVNGAVYSCTVDGPLRLCPDEIVSGEWLDLDEVIERARRESFCPDGIEALLRYLDRLASVRPDPDERTS
jgi:isopentenyldiphosphate isomerase